MSDLEIKVGQVWYNKKSGDDYVVVYVDGSEVTLSGKHEGVFRLDICQQFFEKFILVRESLGDHTIARDDESSITLRDHFAGLAMSGLIDMYGDYDNELMAKNSYIIADAMLKARGE